MLCDIHKVGGKPLPGIELIHVPESKLVQNLLLKAFCKNFNLIYLRCFPPIEIFLMSINLTLDFHISRNALSLFETNFLHIVEQYTLMEA